MPVTPRRQPPQPHTHLATLTRGLGHSTIQVTLGTYGHLFPNLEESLDHALNSVFEGAKASDPGSTHVVSRFGH